MPSAELQKKLPSLLIEGEQVIHISSRWSKAGMINTMLLASPLPIITLASLATLPGSLLSGRPALTLFGVLFFFAILTTLVYWPTYIYWQGRGAILTTKRVMSFSGHGDVIESVPLEQIDKVISSESSVSVRAGSAFNTLNLELPDDATVLAQKIEEARSCRVEKAPGSTSES